MSKQSMTAAGIPEALVQEAEARGFYSESSTTIHQRSLAILQMTLSVILALEKAHEKAEKAQAKAHEPHKSKHRKGR